MNDTSIQKRRGINQSSVLVLYTLSVFLLFTSFLFSIDFVPEKQVTEAHQEELYVSGTEPTDNTTIEQTDSVSLLDRLEEENKPQESSTPTQIKIDAIGIDTPIVAPEDNSIEVLDRALLLGAVYYPGSAHLGETGNVLLFGHSSHLPLVRNNAYKAFNEIHTLKKGEEIVVLSESHEYIYHVEDVQLQKAQEARIYFEADAPMLTLATCDNFGSEEDRWIVTAKQISKKQL